MALPVTVLHIGGVMRCLAGLVAVFVASVVTPHSATAQLFGADATRRVPASGLHLDFEKYTLPNGLVVILSPDRHMEGVVADLSFRAGAYQEPAHRSGMAHFVEHVMFRGPSQKTNYDTLLESRGASRIEAYTSAEMMFFRTQVPAAELPLALWVFADRLRTLPGLIKASELARHRSVIAAERLYRMDDRPFAAPDRVVQQLMYPDQHPLRNGVIGSSKELDEISLSDVRQFVQRTLHASNAVLVLVGNFEVETARRLIESSVATLPKGPKVPRTRPQPRAPKVQRLAVKEHLGRRPRVTMIWHLDGISRAEKRVLVFGAALLRISMSGSLGTQIAAQVDEFDGAAVFRLDVVLPYGKPLEASEAEARGFARYLTNAQVPPDIWARTLASGDLGVALRLSQPTTRASVLTSLQMEFGDPGVLEKELARAWRLAPRHVRKTAFKWLSERRPHSIVHARPVRPRQKKLRWLKRKRNDEVQEHLKQYEGVGESYMDGGTE